MVHASWLRDPSTQKFFCALLARKQELQDKATEASIIDNGDKREHKNLVRSAELKYLLETYARTDQYPYPVTNPVPVVIDDASTTEVEIPISSPGA